MSQRLFQSIYVGEQIERIMSSIMSQQILRLAVLYLCSRCSEFLAEEYVATDKSTIQLIKAYPAIKACTTLKARVAAIEATFQNGASVVLANQFDDSIQFDIDDVLLFLQKLRDNFTAICSRCRKSLSDSISLLDNELYGRMYSAGLIPEGPPDDGAEEDIYYGAWEDNYVYEVQLIQQEYAAKEKYYKSYPYPEDDWEAYNE